jgi:hypothetical protein
MVQERFSDLFFRYLTGKCSLAEERELMEALLDPIWESEKNRLMDEYFDLLPEDGQLEPDRAATIFSRVVGSQQSDIAITHEIPAIGDEYPFNRSTGRRKILRWTIAASVAGIILFTGSSLWRKSVINIPSVSYLPSNMTGKINNTAGPMLCQLEDGSIVKLQPGSKLYYPAHFSTNKREVYLDGEAFFDIGKRPDCPFMVYYNSMVTKVLGTSFNIKTDKLKKLVEVSVVSGKVLVCEVNDSGRTDHEKRTGGVILNPNQKTIYKEEDKVFETTLVNKPVPVVREGIVPDTSARVFRFRETPLPAVMKLLEDMYGIQIVCGDDALVKSLFTGDISSCDLYTKLDIICQSQNATYQIVDTRILIKNKNSN